MHTFEQVAGWLDAICDSIPKEYLSGLNGGVYLLPDTKHSPDIPSDHYFILGEYRHDQVLGDMIFLYYGSIMAVHIDDGMAEIKSVLREIILHELRHHIERLAGRKDLEIEDEQFVRNALHRLNGTVP